LLSSHHIEFFVIKKRRLPRLLELKELNPSVSAKKWCVDNRMLAGKTSSRKSESAGP